jgi:hypothetical protein
LPPRCAVSQVKPGNPNPTTSGRCAAAMDNIDKQAKTACLARVREPESRIRKNSLFTHN